jgi:hypothetical protein
MQLQTLLDFQYIIKTLIFKTFKNFTSVFIYLYRILLIAIVYNYIVINSTNCSLILGQISNKYCTYHFTLFFKVHHL